MTQCYPEPIHFSSVKRRKVEADFSGGAISSNGGIQLLAQVDRRLGLTRSLARLLGDCRRQSSCNHRLSSLLSQRIYALALGHEDLNDHGELRHDPALRTAAGRIKSLASPSTLCRLEQRADREMAVSIHEVLFGQFVAAHPVPPRRLILDFDATDTPLHGEQEERFFHGYYGGYCYLPLYVFCGRHLLVSYLRPSGIDAAHHAWGILRLFGSIFYSAHTWDQARRVIVKAEHSARGANPRFVVTSLEQTDRYLYDRMYCARGDMENRIKEQQLDLFADRASCHRFWPNQFRQLLSGLAYTLIEGLRRLALKNTTLAVASPNRIRLTLLKIGAVVLHNTRRIRLLLSSACVHQELFRTVAWRLDSS